MLAGGLARKHVADVKLVPAAFGGKLASASIALLCRAPRIFVALAALRAYTAEVLVSTFVASEVAKAPFRFGEAVVPPFAFLASVTKA